MDEEKAWEIIDKASQRESMRIGQQIAKGKLEYLTLKENLDDFEKEDIYYGLGRLHARVSYPPLNADLKYYNKLLEAYDKIMPYIDLEKIKKNAGDFRAIVKVRREELIG